MKVYIHDGGDHAISGTIVFYDDSNFAIGSQDVPIGGVVVDETLLSMSTNVNANADGYYSYSMPASRFTSTDIVFTLQKTTNTVKNVLLGIAAAVAGHYIFKALNKKKYVR
jgi:hypothetical protein